MFMINIPRKSYILPFHHRTKIDINNRWMFTYSPVLSETFQTHTNVDSYSSVKSMKYIYKYINKESDQAIFGFKNEHDEMMR